MFVFYSSGLDEVKMLFISFRGDSIDVITEHRPTLLDNTFDIIFAFSISGPFISKYYITI